MANFNILFDRMRAIHGLMEAVDFQAAARFIQFARALKNVVIHSQAPSWDPASALPVLPNTVAVYIGIRLNLSLRHVDGLWDVLKEEVWMDAENSDDNELESVALDPVDLEYHLSLYMLYPPTYICINPMCTDRRLLRHKDDARRAVLFTLNSGVREGYSVHLYCYACNTNYHPNFAVQHHVRTYYGGIPDFIQISEHQFVAREVLNLFTSLILLSWTSATNAAHTYDLALSKLDLAEGIARYSLRPEHVWDGFVLLALLEDHLRRGERLSVPHTGDQKDRFVAAMRGRNLRFRQAGQPEYAHFCTRCTHRYRDADGDWRKVSVVVIDGITIRHPCCGVAHCSQPLANNQHRFCPGHQYKLSECAIEGCSDPCRSDYQTCLDPQHQELETEYKRRNKAMFQLKGRLQRAQVSHPVDAVNPDAAVDDLIEQDGPCPDKPEAGNRRLRARFGRRRTHNEQVITRPCGIIVKRESFFGSETTPQVLDMILKTFPLPNSRPEIAIFDNNCHLYEHSVAAGKTLHLEMGLPVDIFHWKSKHKKTDVTCQVHCNPHNFPELIADDGTWRFNSSIAEQTNVWLGGYHAILREMSVDKYNFFLDEIIMRKNRLTRDKLEASGCLPDYIPGVRFAT